MSSIHPSHTLTEENPMRDLIRRRLALLSALPVLLFSLILSVHAGSAASTHSAAGKWKDYSGPPVTISVWTYPQDDPTLLTAEKAAFQKANPKITVKYVILPEDNYTTKVATTLQAHKPPDVAIIEDQAWMKANKVVRLDPYLKQWGV